MGRVIAIAFESTANKTDAKIVWNSSKIDTAELDGVIFFNKDKI